MVEHICFKLFRTVSIRRRYKFLNLLWSSASEDGACGRPRTANASWKDYFSKENGLIFHGNSLLNKSALQDVKHFLQGWRMRFSAQHCCRIPFLYAHQYTNYENSLIIKMTELKIVHSGLKIVLTSISCAWSSSTFWCCLRLVSSSLFLSRRVLPSSAANCKSVNKKENKEKVRN